MNGLTRAMEGIVAASEVEAALSVAAVVFLAGLALWMVLGRDDFVMLRRPGPRHVRHDWMEHRIGAGLVRRVCIGCGDVQVDLTHMERRRRIGDLDPPPWPHAPLGPGWPVTASAFPRRR